MFYGYMATGEIAATVRRYGLLLHYQAWSIHVGELAHEESEIGRIQIRRFQYRDTIGDAYQRATST